MSSKLYFSELDDERAYTRNALIEKMKEDGISELKIYKAKPEKISGVFFCTEVQEFADVSDPFDNPCGKQCKDYSPRNGKSGRCRFHNQYSYTPSDESITIKLFM